MKASPRDEAATRTAAKRSSPGGAQDLGIPSEALLPGDVVGRFTLLARAGEGGMGQVFAAYDPVLDRRIALKLLRTRGTRREHDRLLREAKALARLSSPHVVSVYEVVGDADRVLVAMEYVDGGTLRQWAAEHPVGDDERFGEALSLLIGAGQGLEAAHAAGLVHRDFKPSNILIGQDGRVRVADFGLARTQTPKVERDESEEVETEQDVSVGSGGSGPSRVTRTGTVAGTPAYMAPEQALDGPVGPKADQYSFCLTAWELLFGERPMSERSNLQLPLRPSATLERALHKGMSRRPDRRHASMGALLRAIRSDARWRQHQATPVKSRTAAWVLATVVGLGAVAGGGNWLWNARLRTECLRAGVSIDEVWNDAVRTRVAEGLTHEALPYSERAAESVPDQLDRYADAWRGAATEACLNHDVRERWDAELFDRALWCLEEGQLELSALTTTLADADAGVVQRAVQGAASLAMPEACLDRARLLGRGPAPSPSMVPQLAEVREAVSLARALEFAGKYDEALEVLHEVRDSVEASGWGPLEASALALEAVLLARLGRYALARRAGQRAFMTSVRADAWHVAVAAANSQTFLVGATLEEKEAGLLWSALADVAISQAGDPRGVAAAARAQRLGSLFRAAGDFAEAKRLAAEAVRLWEHALGPGHPVVANALMNLANAHGDAGEPAIAMKYELRALEASRRSLGEKHPGVATAMANLGVSYISQGQLDAAKEALNGGLAIWVEAAGDTDPQAAMFFNALGTVHELQGDASLALGRFRRALTIYRACFGDIHSDVARTLGSLGNALFALGDATEAEAMYREAVEVARALPGDANLHLGVAAYNLGALLYSLERDQEALPILVEAVSALESGQEGEDPRLAPGLTLLGELAAARRDWESARTSLERALSLPGSESLARSANTRFALARVLWETPTNPDRARALDLARDAVEGYADRPEDRAEAQAWLDARSDD